MLRRIPNHGIGFGILKHIKDLYRGLNAEICFNYLGQFDSENRGMGAITASNVSTGSNSNSKNVSGNQITLNGSVDNDELVFTVSFACNNYTKKSIEEFADLYIDSIKEVIDVCLGQEEVVKTASDFGLDISQDALNEIFDLLG
jgi:non-ribosomal peptide synthase protein (TIGR01720 family)